MRRITTSTIPAAAMLTGGWCHQERNIPLGAPQLAQGSRLWKAASGQSSPALRVALSRRSRDTA